MTSQPAAETPDPLSGAALDALYTTRIEPALVAAEARRRRAMAFFVAVVIAGLLVFAGEMAAMRMVTGGRTLLPPYLVILITAGVTLGIAGAPITSIAQQAKRLVIEALCKPVGLTYSPDAFEPDYGSFQALHLLPAYEEETHEDQFSGSRAGCDFTLSEATLTVRTGKYRRPVFSGQMISVAFPRKTLGRTVVLRDAGLLNGFERPADMQRAGLEDPVFEKAFEVFCTDQVEARYLLTPDFMEKLTALETQYAGARLRCGFADGRMLIALEGVDRFGIGGITRSLVDKRRVTAIAADLSAVFQLIDAVVGRGMRP